MERRRYLATLIAAGFGGLAGCTAGSDSDGSGDPDDTGTDTNDGGGDVGDGGDGDGANGDGGANRGDGVSGSTVGDVDLPVDKSELNRGAPKDGIPAITSPEFGADWGPTEFTLEDSDRVIGVERGERARAYPIRILDYHEVVNDEFDGPLLVTYCPLCGSGMTSVRKADGEVTNFGVSGYLFQSDLVMYDAATDSLWSQIMATAINGPLTGEELELVPSAITTWKTWREDHPDTEVLLPPPQSGTIVEARPRPYEREAYRGYDEDSQIGIGRNDVEVDRLHPKTQVIGVATDDASRAYPFETVESERVINDRVGELPVLVAAAPDGTLVAYDRRVGGTTLEFEPGDDRHMRADGSRWRISTGRAVDGPHEGDRLDQASSATTMFWFAWLDFNGETEVYGHDADAAVRPGPAE